MGPTTHQPGWKRVLAIAARQFGLVTRQQLLALGISSDGIRHRIARGKLHPVYRGVYAVGRPDLTAKARWMAALLACRRGAVLSYAIAASSCCLGLWESEPDVTISPPR